MTCVSLHEILSAYADRTMVGKYSEKRVPKCERCDKQAQGIELHDSHYGNPPYEPKRLGVRPVCEDCAYGYFIPLKELVTREQLLEWKLQLRMKRWYDGFFDGDIELAAEWGKIDSFATADAARQFFVGKPPRVQNKSARQVSARLRAFVLERDNFRCRRCGHSARDGARLHVDHIVPVAKGGKTEEKNLQSLCGDCNLGKSDRDPHPHDLRS